MGLLVKYMPRTLVERIAALEANLESIEGQMAERTQIMKELDDRMRRIEKIMWALLGAFCVVEFGLRLIEVLGGHK